MGFSVGLKRNGRLFLQEKMRHLLVARGWELDVSTNRDLRYKSHFSARKGIYTIVILCGCKTRPILPTEVADLRSAAYRHSMKAIFVRGEGSLYGNTGYHTEGIVVEDYDPHTTLVERIEYSLTRLIPTIRGHTGNVIPPNHISGWVKLIGSEERAVVKIYMDTRFIGAATANVFRKDLIVLGDGKYSFSIHTLCSFSEQEIPKIIVRVYRGEDYVGILFQK